MDENLVAIHVRQYCNRQPVKPMTMKEFAKKAQIPRSTLYHLLKPNKHIGHHYLLKIAQATETHYSILFRLNHPDVKAQSKKGTIPLLDEPQICGDDVSGFIDETLAKGTLVLAGSELHQTWTLQNIGSVVWQNRFLVCVDETLPCDYPDQHFAQECRLHPRQSRIALPITYPNERVSIEAVFDAPKITGRYISYWKMVDDKGNICFPDGMGLMVSVIVRSFDMGAQYAKADK